MNKALILDHAENPRRFEPTFAPTATGKHNHTSCDDEIKVSVLVEDGIIADIGFTGHGCVLCMGCASMLCEIAHRLPLDEAINLSPQHLIVNYATEIDSPRKRCVTVSLWALRKALKGL